MRNLIFNVLPVNLHILLAITTSLMCGIVWYALPCTLGLMLLLSSIAAIVFYASSLRNYNVALALMVLAFVVGVARSHQHNRYHESFFDHIKGRMDIVGTVTDKKVTHGAFTRYCTTLQLQKIKPVNTDEWQACHHTVTLYTTRKLKIKIADIIQVSGVRFTKSNNKGFMDYLHKEGVSATSFMNAIDHTLIERPQRAISRWLFEKRQELLRALRGKLSFSTFALVSTIFLGSKQLKKQTLDHKKELFKRWGIIHYLARSGLHLLIVILLWHLLLRMVPIPYASKELMLTLMILMYCAYSWSSISFIRALSTFMLYKVCVLLRLPINALHILTIACCALLLYNPAQLFALDFQLSFGLTYALAWIAQVRRQKRRVHV